MLEFLRGLFLVLHFSAVYIYINDCPADIIFNIAIYADDTTLYFKCDQVSDLWQQLYGSNSVAASLEIYSMPIYGILLSRLGWCL